MAKKDKITYVKTKSTKEIFPDNPDFDWATYGMKALVDGDSFSKGKVVSEWDRHLTERWNQFEHNRKSSIFKYYGHDYDEPEARTISVPDGETPSGNINPMAADLRSAVEYRINNFTNESVNGWKIFEDITGWYDVEAIDEEVAEKRVEILKKFIGLLAKDEYVSTYDPLTGNEAITEVSASGRMNPIEYMFPLGDVETDYLHYVVLEAQSKEVIIKDDIVLRNLIKREVLKNIINSASEVQQKRMMGLLMKNYKKQLRPRIDFVLEELNKWILTYNSLFTMEGIKSLNAELEALPFQELEEEPGDGPLVETYKKILVSSLIKKIKDKDLKNKLLKIKPPEKAKQGGRLWPKSKGGEYALWITTDPFEMLTKSTGRLWSEKSASCENWDGCYARGPVSDFRYGNCIVWVYKRGQTEYRQEIGRFILRWGNSYKGGELIGRDVGVEIQVYPKDPSQSPWGFNILGAIGRILKDAGLLNYDYCKTPYVFNGYSDKAGSGNTKIEYDSKIFLKGMGEVEVGDANALVVMANDERMSYGDSGYILNYGNENALLALSMNPIIWAYENTIRRLVNRCLDMEAGNQIIRFLVEADVANFEFIQGIVDNIDLYDENYGNPLARDNVCQGLLRNGRCNEGTHYAMLKSHEGYTVGGIDVGGIDEMVYLALFDTNSTLAGGNNYPPIISSVPTEMLDTLIDKLVSNELQGDKQERMNIWLERYGGREAQIYEASKASEMKLYRRYREFLVGMKHLMFCPNLSLRAFGKMLTEFKNLYTKYGDLPGVFGQSLQTVRNFMGLAISLPFKNADDWGYCEEYNGVYLGMGNTHEALRYQKFDRQSKRTVVVAAEIMPELINLDVGGSTPLGLEGLLLSNIRTTSAYASLWKNKRELDIDPLAFMSRQMDNKDNSLSNPNRFVSPEIEISIIKLLRKEDIKLIQESYKYNQETAIVRSQEDISIPAVNYLLGIGYEKSQPEFLFAIGYNYVASWLRTSAQFLVFENLVLAEAIGSYYSPELPPGSVYNRQESSFEEPPQEYNMENIKRLNKETQNIDVLQIAACGGISQIGGLVANEQLPPFLQRGLLGSWINEGEGLSWNAISEIYGGSYDEYINIIKNSIAIHTHLDESLVSQLIGQTSELDESLARHGNIKDNTTFIDDMLLKNPLWLLENKNLTGDQYSMVVDYYKDYLLATPPEERDRFERMAMQLGLGGQGFLIHKMTMKENIWGEEGADGEAPEVVGWRWNYGFDTVLSQIHQLFLNHPWLKFWRGGNHKKAMGLPHRPNTAPLNGGTGKPMALVDEPILIERPQIILTMDFEDKDGEPIRTFQSVKYIKNIEVSEEEELITIRGTNYVDGEDFVQEFTDVSQLYEFITPIERENENKWRRGIVLVLYDGYIESEIRDLPSWRESITSEEFEKSLYDMASNPYMLLPMLKSLGEKMEEGLLTTGAIYSEEGPIPATLDNLFEAIDKADVWKVSFINKFKKEIFNRRGFYLNSSNLSPPSKILELSLSLDNVEIQEELGLSPRHIYELQNWILTEFGSKIPIDYIYQIIGHPRAEAYIKDIARNLREQRIREYVDFVTRDELPEINDAEEGDHNKLVWLNLEAPKMNNLLVDYVSIVEPVDIEKQNNLLESITNGEENISLEEIIKVVEQQRV